MRKLFLSFLFLSVSIVVTAAERPASKMRRAALSTLNSVHAECTLSKPTLDVYTDGKHFSIVSRDDRFPEVLAYGMGRFDVDNLPSNVKWWFDMVQLCMESAVKRNAPARASKVYTPIEPLLTTKWGQWTPYNSMCPRKNGDETDQDDERCPSGCVATAMAQIMNYQQYPAGASFEGSCYLYDKEHDARSIQSTYAWPFLDAYRYYYPDGYTSEEDYKVQQYSAVQGKRVATLMRDCGYAIDMNYTLDGSGATSFDAGRAFVEKFQYPKIAVKMWERDYFSTDEWLDLLHWEFQNGTPVLYGGYGTNTGSLADMYGHAFILHGMDSNGLVYVNWGWNGAGDGYYAIDLLNPDEESSFSLYQDAVIGIRPTALSTDVVQSMLATDEPYTIKYSSKTSELTLALAASLYNISIYDLNGQVRFTIEDKTDSKTIVEENLLDTGEVLQSYYGWEASDRFLYGTMSFTAGHTYHAYLESKDDSETDWQKVRTIGGAFYYEITCDRDGEVTISDPIFVSKETPTAIQSVTTNVGEDDVVRYYDMHGRQVDSSTRGLLIRKQGSDVKKIMVK